ncbi:MAG: hypothetical protein ABW352_21995 [Polyangiales bacterium]
MRETAKPLFTTTQTRRYRGGCQCGCVVYEASLDLASAHASAPSVWERRTRGFKLLRGEAELRGYEFATADLHHFFCERCGTRAFSHVTSPACGDFYTVDLKSLHVSTGTPTSEPSDAHELARDLAPAAYR